MKSKIKIIFALVVLLLVGVLLAIPKTTYEKWFSNESVIDNVVNEEDTDSLLVYLQNTDGKLVGVNVKVDNLEDDLILQKWNLLTSSSNELPNGYTSVINKDAVLNSYEIKEHVLVLDVSPEIKMSSGRSAVEALAWTFEEGEIEEIKLVVNNEPLTEINGYRINKINKKIGINLEYETGYLLESTATTVVYSMDNYLLPVTYFHLEEDICTYIVEKTFAMFDEDSSEYEYELNEEALVINFSDDITLSENALETLTKSVEVNFELIKFTINNSSENLYEAVFGEITEE